MFIQRGLYVIGNEVLLIPKKLENKKTDKEELLNLLSKNVILTTTPEELSPCLTTVLLYLKSVYVYLKSLKEKPRVFSSSPKRKSKKKSVNTARKSENRNQSLLSNQSTEKKP